MMWDSPWSLALAVAVLLAVVALGVHVSGIWNCC